MIRKLVDRLRGRDRCDMPQHREMGHEDSGWEYVESLECWRRLCADCQTLTGVSDKRPRGVGE